MRKRSVTKFILSAKKIIANEDAPTMVEYGLLVALIALVVAAAASVLGQGISTLFNTAANSV
jgi:pilus assembly protein Flp/PilA